MRARLLPWLLPLSLAAALLALAGWRASLTWGRPGSLSALDLGFVALYLVWMLLELGVTRRDAAAGDAPADGRTRELYGAAHALTVLSALGLGAGHTRLEGPALLGLGLFASGVALRLWAIRTLGRHYSHAVRTLTDHRIVADGPYRLVRHPAYAGMLVAHLGVLALYANPWTCLALFAGLLPAVVHRIRIEERVLGLLPGYLEFSASRARLVPFVW